MKTCNDKRMYVLVKYRRKGKRVRISHSLSTLSLNDKFPRIRIQEFLMYITITLNIVIDKYFQK